MEALVNPFKGAGPLKRVALLRERPRAKLSEIVESELIQKFRKSVQEELLTQESWAFFRCEGVEKQVFTNRRGSEGAR